MTQTSYVPELTQLILIEMTHKKSSFSRSVVITWAGSNKLLKKWSLKGAAIYLREKRAIRVKLFYMTMPVDRLRLQYLFPSSFSHSFVLYFEWNMPKLLVSSRLQNKMGSSVIFQIIMNATNFYWSVHALNLMKSVWIHELVTWLHPENQKCKVHSMSLESSL